MADKLWVTLFPLRCLFQLVNCRLGARSFNRQDSQCGVSKRMVFKMASFVNSKSQAFWYPFILVPVWVSRWQHSKGYQNGWFSRWQILFQISATGRIRFRIVRFQTPSSVSFLAFTELRGENSVSSSQPIICVPNRTHRIFRRTHRVCRKTQ